MNDDKVVPPGYINAGGFILPVLTPEQNAELTARMDAAALVWSSDEKDIVEEEG